MPDWTNGAGAAAHIPRSCAWVPRAHARAHVTTHDVRLPCRGHTIKDQPPLSLISRAVNTPHRRHARASGMGVRRLAQPRVLTRLSYERSAPPARSPLIARAPTNRRNRQHSRMMIARASRPSPQNPAWGRRRWPATPSAANPATARTAATLPSFKTGGTGGMTEGRASSQPSNHPASPR